MCTREERRAFGGLEVELALAVAGAGGIGRPIMSHDESLKELQCLSSCFDSNMCKQDVEKIHGMALGRRAILLLQDEVEHPKFSPLQSRKSHLNEYLAQSDEWLLEQTPNETVLEPFQQAAEMGDTFSMVNLGVCHLGGFGLPQDMKKAAQMFERAANEGNPIGKTCLGFSLYTGKGVEKDMRRGAELYKRAAQMGYAFAMVRIGLYYQNGGGVNKNVKKATKWLKQASDVGQSYGMLLLANCILK